ncbi:3-methyladenine DNA glycosylase AlkC [Pseudomonas arsenicoxydans]|uniref:3-methyladenine DNA glycosylase AlkC n=1 Tax=Pseudomonas arsenicoxydans TaxID=702115 RepID=A0A1H0GRD8_9PSED|nr:hypothetical protein [Pseudomonas arsenicoxydans]SDO09636.1 3-methyladenine DNA glycosylase AlkC [Pseudomonas arsenicoxydans]
MDFKDYFDHPLGVELGGRAAALLASFDQQRYSASLPADLRPLEMKARVKVMANALWDGLGLEFVPAARVLLGMLDPIPGTRFGRMTGFPVWVIADIFETRGLEHFEPAMQAIKKVTQHFTGEFAIRPYLDAYLEPTLQVLAGWVSDDSTDVRRLVSEGTRPRLPWASRVPSLLVDPAPVLALLERLRNDRSEYVRRSVANNLNDISKDHPSAVLDVLERWQVEERGPHTDWVIRHSLRTLARRGDSRALELLGYSMAAPVRVKRFQVGPSQIKPGERISLDCDIQIDSTCEHGLMVDYAILAPGARGQINRRVFKWSKRQKLVKGSVKLQRDHSIESSSLRSYYPGAHEVHLIINGQVVAQGSFELGV